jgi:hypothetical protein
VINEEKIRLVTSNRSEIKFTVDETTLEKLQQLKNLIGNSSLEKIFDQALDALLLTEKNNRGVDPKKVNDTNSNPVIAAQGRPADLLHLKTRTEAQLNSRFIPIDLKRFVFARSKGQCEFVGPRTKARCESRFRLQIDHKLAFALGGKTEAANLRHLCSPHNLWMARQAGFSYPLSTVLSPCILQEDPDKPTRHQSLES